MYLSAILGLQWGDEGKGKIIDCISRDYDIVVRFQGGNNAGHTIVNQGKVYKLSHIPSGILQPHQKVLLGSGMVIELSAFFKELETVAKEGINVSSERLKIAENAHLLFPFYKEVDALLEEMKSAQKIGTTHKGIGVAYQDAVARRGLRLIDILENKAFLLPKLAHLTAFYAPLLKAAAKPVPATEDLLAFIETYKERIRPYLVHPYLFFEAAKRQRQRILFEGAQGFMLDINWGTYPYVTSSNTHLAQVFLGTGVAFRGLDKSIGILKAYTTRVGSGPFFTEDFGALGCLLQEKGVEIGTVTQRKRRCGALDLVAVKYAVTLSGVTEIALTKMDVLDDLEEIPVAVAYTLHNRTIDYVPTGQQEQLQVQPVYKRLKGWRQPLSECRTYEQLPEAAKAYIAFIEAYLGVPVTIISVGADTAQTIYR